MLRNGLTEKELERLACLAEECGEVVQIVNKIIRHGMLSSNPNDPNRLTNNFLLESELGDIKAVMDIMCDEGMISKDHIKSARKDKKLRLREWLHFPSN